jgi:hypothetical protein
MLGLPGNSMPGDMLVDKIDESRNSFVELFDCPSPPPSTQASLKELPVVSILISTRGRVFNL